MKKVLVVLGSVLGLLVLASNGIGYSVDDIDAARGETDYQKGVHEGLLTGLKMGQLLGLAQGGNLTAAAEFNKLLDKYHFGLIEIFGNNSEVKRVFFLPRLEDQDWLLKDKALLSNELVRAGDYKP